jgi:hypothetical protein
MFVEYMVAILAGTLFVGFGWLVLFWKPSVSADD